MKTDLFTTPEVLPKKVKAILNKFENSENDYKDCENLKNELEKVGYTCDFGLDAVPFDLFKIDKSTNVHCYIYETFNERGTKRFENNVMLFLKRNGIFGNVICHNAYMRGQGRGSYLKFADIEINGNDYTLAEHTNDSQMWDNWENPTSKDKRNLFLAVLESQIETLKQAINEQTDQNE